MEPVRQGLGLQELGLQEQVRLELGLLERVSPVEVHDDDEGEVEDEVTVEVVVVEVVVVDPPLLHLLQPLPLLRLPRVQHES